MNIRKIALSTALAGGLVACSADYRPELQQTQLLNKEGVDTLSLEKNINSYCDTATPMIRDKAVAEDFCRKEHWIKSIDSIQMLKKASADSAKAYQTGFEAGKKSIDSTKIAAAITSAMDDVEIKTITEKVAKMVLDSIQKAKKIVK